MSLIDGQGRQFKSLRLSLTAACNFTCGYCVPEGTTLRPAPNALDGQSLIRLVQLLDRVLGLEKIRLTGGEPLIAPNLKAVLEGLQTIPVTTSITTNGQFLAKHARALHDAGVKAVNVSLDALDPAAFDAMAGGGDVDSVLAGIEASLALGQRIKMNTVPMRSKNIDQLAPLFDYCATRGIELRFIELMRMGHLSDRTLFEKEFISEAEIVEILSVFGKAQELPRKAHSTSRSYQNPRGRFGFIANESAPFCSDCDRLRLTSDGQLFGCISSALSQDIRPALAMEEPDALAFLQAQLSLALKVKQPVRFSGEQTIMQIIGG